MGTQIKKSERISIPLIIPRRSGSSSMELMTIDALFSTNISSHWVSSPKGVNPKGQAPKGAGRGGSKEINELAEPSLSPYGPNHVVVICTPENNSHLKGTHECKEPYFYGNRALRHQDSGNTIELEALFLRGKQSFLCQSTAKEKLRYERVWDKTYLSLPVKKLKAAKSSNHF